MPNLALLCPERITSIVFQTETPSGVVPGADSWHYSSGGRRGSVYLVGEFGIYMHSWDFVILGHDWLLQEVAGALDVSLEELYSVSHS